VRHADAGYEKAQQIAKQKQIKMPMLKVVPVKSFE
jgi:urocanate hydratase